MDVLALSAAFMLGHHFLQKEALCWVTSSAQQAVSISLAESLPLTLGWAQSPTDMISPPPGWKSWGRGGDSSHYSEGNRNRHHNASSLFILSFLYLSSKY